MIVTLAIEPPSRFVEFCTKRSRFLRLINAISVVYDKKLFFYFVLIARNLIVLNPAVLFASLNVAQ